MKTCYNNGQTEGTRTENDHSFVCEGRRRTGNGPSVRPFFIFRPKGEACIGVERCSGGGRIVMTTMMVGKNGTGLQIIRFVYRIQKKRPTVSTTDPAVPNGSVVCFCGTTPNIGTTVVAFGTAIELARRMKDDVAYICLNLKSSKIHRYLGVDEPADSIDAFRAEIRARALSPDRLRRKAWRDPRRELPANLFVVFGNRLREQADYFSGEDVSYFLENARRAFRLCVVDVHAFWDNAATVTTMRKANVRLLVTTPDVTHFQEDMDRWFKTLAPYADIATSDMRLVLNHPNAPGGVGVAAADVCRETGIKLAAVIPHCSEMLSVLNQGRILDIFRRFSAVDESVRSLADRLVTMFRQEEGSGGG